MCEVAEITTRVKKKKVFQDEKELRGRFAKPDLTVLTLPMAAVQYPALVAILARLVSLLGRPALPAAEMITGGVLASPGTARWKFFIRVKIKGIFRVLWIKISLS